MSTLAKFIITPSSNQVIIIRPESSFPGQADWQNQLARILRIGLDQTGQADEQDVIPLILNTREPKILMDCDVAEGREEPLDRRTSAAVGIVTHNLLSDHHLGNLLLEVPR